MPNPAAVSKIQVPYFTLERQTRKLRGEIEESFQNLFDSGRFILGETVAGFENRFAAYCGSRHGVGVASGTDALRLALQAAGVRPGDEVIVPSFTFVATAYAVLHAGAKPVFADIDPNTFTLDPRSVEKAVTRKTRAVIPVHLYGQTADMDALMTLARRRRLKVIEDACQAHGSRWKDRKAGSFGDAGCFSFYPTKNLGAFGDGGMTVTAHEAIAKKLRSLRNLGRADMTAPHGEVGWTSRLDALQAAVLDIKLKYLDEFNRLRRSAASRYCEMLSGTPVKLPVESRHGYHVYHLFVIRVPGGKRNALREALAAEGIPTMLHYPLPVHRQPAIRRAVRRSPRLPVTDRVSREILSLPMFPEIKTEEVERVAAVIRRFYERA